MAAVGPDPLRGYAGPQQAARRRRVYVLESVGTSVRLLRVQGASADPVYEGPATGPDWEAAAAGARDEQERGEAWNVWLFPAGKSLWRTLEVGHAAENLPGIGRSGL